MILSSHLFWSDRIRTHLDAPSILTTLHDIKPKKKGVRGNDMSDKFIFLHYLKCKSSKPMAPDKPTLS